MTIHEMLHQVALLSNGIYRRANDISSIEVRLTGGRRQNIFGKVEEMGGHNVGMLYTNVGVTTPGMDLAELLAINATLRYARVALSDENRIVLMATFDLINTSVKECAPMLQEIAAVADNLEKRFFSVDEN